MKEMMLLCLECTGERVKVELDYTPGEIVACLDCSKNYCIFPDEELLYKTLADKEKSPITKEEIERVSDELAPQKYRGIDIKSAAKYLDKKTNQPIAWMVELSEDGKTTQIYYTEAITISDQPGE